MNQLLFLQCKDAELDSLRGRFILRLSQIFIQSFFKSNIKSFIIICKVRSKARPQSLGLVYNFNYFKFSRCISRLVLTVRKLEVGDCTRARKTPKQQATRRANVDKGHHLCVCTDSNPTNIWNRGFWTSAPLPLSIGSLAEHNPSRECQQNKLYKPRICAFWAWPLNTLSPGTVGLKPNVELNVSYRILYLRSRRRALFDPLWEGWRNFSTPSSEGSTVGTLFFCTLLQVTQKALRHSPQLTHTNFSFAASLAETSRSVH